MLDLVITDIYETIRTEIISGNWNKKAFGGYQKMHYSVKNCYMILKLQKKMLSRAIIHYKITHDHKLHDIMNKKDISPIQQSQRWYMNRISQEDICSGTWHPLHFSQLEITDTSNTIGSN